MSLQVNTSVGSAGETPASLSVNFIKEKESGYERIFRRSPLVSSVSVGWDDLCIVYDRYPSGEIPKILVKQHCIGIFTDIPSPIQAERKIDGCLVQEQNMQGDIVIIPANISHQVAWNKPGNAISIAIDPTVFAQTIYEVVDPEIVELLPHFATADPFVYQIGLALKSVLVKHGTNSRLYAETLINNTLIVHLLEYYSVRRQNSSECVGGKLPQYKLQQIIDYIYAHLDLSLKELGTVVQMSPHYFSQLFSLVAKSPAPYP